MSGKDRLGEDRSEDGVDTDGETKVAAAAGSARGGDTDVLDSSIHEQSTWFTNGTGSSTQRQWQMVEYSWKVDAVSDAFVLGTTPRAFRIVYSGSIPRQDSRWGERNNGMAASVDGTVRPKAVLSEQDPGEQG